MSKKKKNKKNNETTEEIKAEEKAEDKAEDKAEEKTEEKTEEKARDIKIETGRTVAGVSVGEKGHRDPKEDLKGFARMKAEMKDMPPLKKVGYLLYYNKVYIILAAILIIWIISFINTQRANSLPTAISYAILNTGNHTTAYELESPDNPFNDYLKEFGYTEDGTFQVQGNASIELSKDTQRDDYVRTQESSAAVMQFGGLLDKDFYDVIITDEPGLDYLVTGEDSIRIQPADQILGEYVDYLDISDRIISLKDKTGTEYKVAVDISDRDFTKKLDLPYDKVYLCFGGKSEENKENARRFCEYLFK